MPRALRAPPGSRRGPEQPGAAAAHAERDAGANAGGGEARLGGRPIRQAARGRHEGTGDGGRRPARVHAEGRARHLHGQRDRPAEHRHPVCRPDGGLSGRQRRPDRPHRVHRERPDHHEGLPDGDGETGRVLRRRAAGGAHLGCASVAGGERRHRRAHHDLPRRGPQRGGGRQAGAGEGRVLPETRGPAGRRRQGGPPRSVPVMEGLIAQGLVKRFRNRLVVDGISLDIPRGEVVGLLGPNGAGKTTSFYMIVGLLRPEGGRIFLEGQEITDLPMYLRCRKGMGYLPQESSVFRKLTVEENLLAILETMDLSAQERAARLRVLLAELDLTPLARHKAYTLSGGERRRLEITRALVTNPRYLLLDEPFTGIDPIAIGDIQEIVARLKERGIGVLITDHNVRETLAITDRAYILYHGRILASGTATELASNPKAREIYLGEKFSL